MFSTTFREFRKHTSTADDCCSFPDFFRSLVAAWRLKHVIAVDLVWYLIEEKEKLVELLREHIFNNVVRIGNKYYQQIRGKPSVIGQSNAEEVMSYKIMS